MKELLKQIQILESEMNIAQQQSDYWLEEEHFDAEKSESFELEADEIYERLYRLFEQAADKIVSITSGQIEKSMARAMLHSRRSEVERIFA